MNEITPNPFVKVAIIEFMVPLAYEVQILILDKQGREVRNLLDCMPLAGIYHIVWDGLDDDGDRVKAGRYMCRFIAGDYEETQVVAFGRY